MEEKKIVHFCLLNEDPSSILTPIVDPNISSHKLVIASIAKYKKYVARVIKLAQARGYSAEHKLLPDGFCTDELRNTLVDIFTELDNSEYELWFNATNGHRFQSLMAFEVARELDIPTFIVNESNDALYWLFPSSWQNTKVQDKLKLAEYVQLYDSTLTSQDSPNGISANRKELGHQWVVEAEKLSKALANLNYLAFTGAGADYTSASLNQVQQNSPQLSRLLEDLEAAGMLEFRGNKVAFLNPENKFFCNGGWLEEFVYATVIELKRELKTIQDHAHSAVLERKIGANTVKNEIDVAALVNNKLHIIECKTKKFDKGEGVSTLYKLDSVNDVVGGIRGKAALVSYFPLNPSEMLRAKELSIKVFGPTELKNFKHHLKNWFIQS